MGDFDDHADDAMRIANMRSEIGRIRDARFREIQKLREQRIREIYRLDAKLYGPTEHRAPQTVEDYTRILDVDADGEDKAGAIPLRATSPPAHPDDGLRTVRGLRNGFIAALALWALILWLVL